MEQFRIPVHRNPLSNHYLWTKHRTTGHVLIRGSVVCPWHWKQKMAASVAGNGWEGKVMTVQLVWICIRM